jgi:drug/metabolite transporter (DMT)-like permease
MALFGTAMAYIIFFKLLVSAGASNVMLVTLLIPITAVMLGSMFLDEIIRTQEIIGALVIGFGLLFIDGRILKLFTHKS